MASQDSSQPPSQPPANPPDGEAGRIKSIDSRFSAIETEQKEQRGILGRIEAALTGGGSPKAPPAGPASSADSPPGGMSVADQVRRGVEEIQAKQQRDAADQAAADSDKQWRQSVEDRLLERKPAEPMTGMKARLQRALFGKQDER